MLTEGRNQPEADIGAVRKRTFKSIAMTHEANSRRYAIRFN
jgi:hypothetical protein